MPSGFIGFRFPPEVILLAVRWHLQYGLSYRDLEELSQARALLGMTSIEQRNRARARLLADGPAQGLEGWRPEK